MKKRLMAILLVVCTMAAMLSGLCISASASNDISGDAFSGYVVGYTLAKDDTVGKVCKRLGIDFYQNQTTITKINNITDYSKLPVGKVVWLPVTEAGSADNYYTLKTHTLVAGDSLETLCSKYGISTSDVLLSRLNGNLSNLSVGGTIVFPSYTGSGNGLGNATTTVPVSGTVTTGTVTGGTTSAGTIAAVTGTDTLAYYLIPYVMQAGDTVADVCARLGIDFSSNQATITKLNNITNYARIAVGRTILLPSNSAGSGSSYAVYAHRLNAGESVYQLCLNYGINYGNSQALLKALNNTNYLDSVMAGNIFYLPVSGTYSISGPTGTPTTPATGTAHNLSKDAATNGSFALKVNGTEVTSAQTGATVTIVCNGNNGYVQTDIDVYKTGAKTTKVATANNTFVMPDYDVTVGVVFGKATYHAVTLTAATNGTYSVKADDAIVSGSSPKAYGGAKMFIETKPNDGYCVDTIKIYKTSDPETEIQEVNGYFTMPNYDITIEVTYKPGENYLFKLNSETTRMIQPDGTITDAGVYYHEFQVNGVVVSSAKAGTKVNIVNKTDKNVRPYSYLVTYTNTKGEPKEVPMNANTFVMPSDIKEGTEVKAVVTYISTTTYTISANTVDGNTVYAAVKGTTNGVGKAEAGLSITVWPKAKSNAYELASVQIVDAKDGKTVLATVDSGNDFTFVMPQKNIKLVPTFVAAGNHSITVSGSNATVSMMAAGVSKDITSTPGSAKPGQTVNLTVRANANYTLAGYKVTYYYGGVDREVTVTNNNFTMPVGDVTITLDVKAAKNAIVTNVTTAGPNGSDDSVIKYFPSSGSTALTEAAQGEIVVIQITPKDGDAVKSIKVTYKDDNGKTQEVALNTADNSFVMPAYEVKVSVEFQTGKYNVSVAPVANGTITIYDSSDIDGKIIDKQAMGSAVYAKAVAAEGYKLGKVYYTDMSGTKLGDAAQVGTTNFYKIASMPAEDIRVCAEFNGPKQITIALSGTGTLVVNGKSVADGDTVDAFVGDEIKVEATPGTGCALRAVKVTDKDNTKDVTFNGTSFIMPEFETLVSVKFVTAAEHKITMLKTEEYPEGIETYLTVDGIKLDASDLKAFEGKTVVIEANTTDNYIVESITVTRTDDGSAVKVNGKSFAMPEVDVEIVVTFAAR